ncbi:hypothetical protein [Paraburkholderia sp. BR10954]|uniref:hypothetical protein n=1 Tax=Paraburkholderia sp. BR10954 TaxID=3236995 RepID=UPI0034D38B1B
MDEIEALAARVDYDPDVDALRLAIADLIGSLIAERRDALGYWEKHWFAQALASLAWNVGGRHRDSTAWLRLSLVALQTALVPLARRSDDYAPLSADIEALTAEQLLDDARALGGRV